MNYVLICFFTSILGLESRLVSRKTSFKSNDRMSEGMLCIRRAEGTPNYSCHILSTQYLAVLLATFVCICMRTVHHPKESLLS